MAEERRPVRAVFDCKVFLQGAARGASPAGVCLRLVELGVVELLISDEVTAEIADGLRRPILQKKFRR